LQVEVQQENKGKVAVSEGNVTSANNARNGSVMSTDRDFEFSEKRNEGNVDTLMEIKSESEVDKSAISVLKAAMM